ncbi:hypothetical protein [Pontimicrobium sp. IMCC45349]|uniref:hypothetical protein n=1 Tax=Pontimicrobium sp. IMCC45349 TaxID=3391574 RepID=UPI00399FD97B
MARSGETVLLRTLNAHSKIKVVHNLNEKENKEEVEAFNLIKNHKGRKISFKNKIISQLGVKKDQCLVIKQGVWTHKYPFNGFILVRNPISIFASLKSIGLKEVKGTDSDYWEPISERMKRWLKDIEPQMMSKFDELDNIDQFCLFYNIRMMNLHNLGLPKIYYEEFVNNPEQKVKEILGFFDLDYENGLLESHKQYNVGEIGHGYNDMSKPISTESIYKYKKLISKKDFEDILLKTKETLEAYSYSITWDEINILKDNL